MQHTSASSLAQAGFCCAILGISACSGQSGARVPHDNGHALGAEAAGGTSDPAGGSASGGNRAGSEGAGASAIQTNAGQGAGGASNEPPGLQFFGRWDHTDPQKAAGSWGPIGLKARFQGKSVRVKLSDAQNTFTYSIDGGPQQLLAASAETERMLASDLPDGEHTLELFRRSEGGYGKTVVGGLLLDPGKALLSPPPRPPHKLEVVGDSISAGFGDEGMSGSTPATQNGYMAYGPQLARLLDAEWSIVAHSGQGLYRNLCEALPPSKPHMPDEFLLTQHPAVMGPSWDFTSWQPDVLIVALGTNDFADYPVGSCPAPTSAAFQSAYQAFLSLVRSKYPHAEVFALGTFIATAGNAFGTCNQTICAAVKAQSDPHLHCIDPSLGAEGMWLTGPGDYIGDWTHPTVAGHTKLAQKLAQVIKPVLGW